MTESRRRHKEEKRRRKKEKKLRRKAKELKRAYVLCLTYVHPRDLPGVQVLSACRARKWVGREHSAQGVTAPR